MDISEVQPSGTVEEDIRLGGSGFTERTFNSILPDEST